MITQAIIFVKSLKESIEYRVLCIESRKRKKIKNIGRTFRLSTKMFDLSNQRISYVCPIKPCFTGVIPVKPVLDLIRGRESKYSLPFSLSLMSFPRNWESMHNLNIKITFINIIYFFFYLFNYWTTLRR